MLLSEKKNWKLPINKFLMNLNIKSKAYILSN